MTTMSTPPPADKAADIDMYNDADGDVVIVGAPRDLSQPIDMAVVDQETFDMQNPISIMTFTPAQAIEIGQALVRAGIRRQLLLEGNEDNEEPHN